MLTLKIQQMTVNEHPMLCPECTSPAFTLDGNGFIDGFPVWGNCWCGYSWEDPLITLGVLKQIDAARTGRAKAEDDDTFEIEIGGALFAGLLHPDVTVDDIKRVARDAYWKRLIKPAIRKQKRKVIRAAKRPVKNSVAAAKAAAIGAAWGLQAGGHEPDPDYQPEPINPCVACSGKGHHKIDSRLHETKKVRCSVCHGTGEID